MTLDVSKIIKRLRREFHAQKQNYQKVATQINLITKTLTFTTSKNACRYAGGGIAFDYEDNERVVVTLATSSGANTLAKLEVSGNYDTVPVVRRVPYAGGARWIISTAPRQSGGAWAATTYNFAVQTLVNGALSAKMVWEV